MKTKILITGANGFIGCHLKEWLSVTRYKIYTTSRDDGDISDEKYVKSLYSIKPNIIIHLAFDISREDSYEVYLRQLNNNIKSMLLIAELAKKCKAKLIIPSTVSLYANNNKKFIESNSIDPRNVYSLSKYVCEQITKIYDLDYLILRIGILYGKNQSCNMLIPNIINHIKENKVIEIYGGDQTRDFLYIDDFCELIFISVVEDISGIYNVGYGKSYSIKYVIQTIEKLMGKKCLVKYKKLKNNEILNYSINNKLAKKIFNWKPQTSLLEGLKNII
jgi:nucleoside-diphosphate-sugar epimerase